VKFPIGSNHADLHRQRSPCIPPSDKLPAAFGSPKRETGKPLFPIEHRRFLVSDVDGETLAETQPVPSKPPPFARQRFTEEIVTQRTPEAHKALLSQFRKVRSAG
jgi:hypothetical protein